MTEKVQKIYEKLKEEYPDVRCELNYETPLQLLVATVLSAQTTDRQVNRVTETFFKDCPDLDHLLQLSQEEIETYTDALRCVIEACPIDRTRRNVALSHQFATSGGAETERTDSELSLGGIDNVDASVYDPFDYVALGHVHKPQRVGREEVRYSGSLLKYSFSEIKGEKTMPLVELGPKGEVDIEFVPIVPLHDMRPLRGPLEKLLEPENVAAGDPEDYLSVTLTDELPALDALERLRRVFPNVMGLSYDNAELSDVSPLELFERFYEERNGLPMTERQREYAIRAFEKAQVI